MPCLFRAFWSHGPQLLWGKKACWIPVLLVWSTQKTPRQLEIDGLVHTKYPHPDSWKLMVWCTQHTPRQLEIDGLVHTKYPQAVGNWWVRAYTKSLGSWKLVLVQSTQKIPRQLESEEKSWVDFCRCLGNMNRYLMPVASWKVHTNKVTSCRHLNELWEVPVSYQWCHTEMRERAHENGVSNTVWESPLLKLL